MVIFYSMCILSIRLAVCEKINGNSISMLLTKNSHCVYLKPTECRIHHHNQIHQEPFLILFLQLRLYLQVVSFLNVLRPKFCMYLSFPHAPANPILFQVIILLIFGKNYAIFCNPRYSSLLDRSSDISLTVREQIQCKLTKQHLKLSG